MQQNFRNKGYTLFELLISMTLSLFILSMCLSAYLGMHREWMRQQGMAVIQENARMLYGIFDNALKSSQQVERHFSLKNSDSIPRSCLKRYQSGTELLKIQSVIYYIGNTGRMHVNGESILALYALDLKGRHLELMEGVEAMKITELSQSQRIEIAVLLSSSGLGNGPIQHRWWTYVFQTAG